MIFLPDSPASPVVPARPGGVWTHPDVLEVVSAAFAPEPGVSRIDNRDQWNRRRNRA